ncbi:MAG: transporter substrate-binding domain-containing protein [Alcaligenaceae bacterium]|jgi:histidine transport system substrate-binding protein|nr:transporter substrate-binding domain-containing protein [Alcaligenaceae bacterium]
MKKLTSLVFAAIFGFTSFTVSAQEMTELRIGAEAAYAPFEYKLPSGELAGFDIDIGNAICEKLDMKCVWVEQAFDSLIPGLLARKFDLVHSAMTVTEERKKVIDFTDPLYEVSSQLVAAKDSGIDGSDESLKGKTVGVLQGTVQETYARQRWDRRSGVRVTSYMEQTQTIEDLKVGRVDAILFESPNAVEGLLNTPDGEAYAFVGEPILNDPIMNNEIAIGIRLGQDELKDKINAAIKELKEEGVIEQFAKKYFQESEISIVK